jgi:hypothetical protein
VRLVFILSARPPRPWIDHFQQAFGVRISGRRGQRLAVPTPTVQPDGIHVMSRVSEEDVASWTKAVMQHVSDANTWYVDNVIAAHERNEAAEREAEQEDERIEDEMRRMVDKSWKDDSA